MPTQKPQTRPSTALVPFEQRATEWQLKVVQSYVKVLGLDECEFRQEVIRRQGAQVEELAKRVACELTKNANGS